MDIKLGDVVALKSGGPYMTVSYFNVEDGRFASVDVVYFDNEAFFRTEENIPVECLRIKKEEA